MMKSDLKNEKFCLFFLKSIRGLKESLVADLIKNGFLPKEILQTPPPVLQKIIAEAKNNQEFLAKIRTEFLTYQDAISILDAEYPKLLKTIFDPPLFLFYQGNLELLHSQYLLTIVGSRTLTQYHQNTLTTLLADFAQTPLVIVSGLALGIDAWAHQQALANKLHTIAVLGSGFAEEVLYPHQNLLLAKKIVQTGGLLLSEYPPLTRPNLYQFPKRNRILAGLSKASMIISGAQKSGTLITAQCALDNGREIYALPGNINFYLSSGPNELIEQGANILLNSKEILKIYDLDKTPNSNFISLTKDEQDVYQYLRQENHTFTQLQNKIQMSAGQLNKTLSQLELKNLISLNQLNEWEINHL